MRIEGTKLRNGTYNLNLRIPVELQPLYENHTHLRRSLKTREPRVAKFAVITAQLKFEEELKKLNWASDQVARVANLQADLKKIIDDAGGVEALKKLHKSDAAGLAFLQASTRVRLEGDDSDDRHDEEVELDVEADQVYTDRAMARARTSAKPLQALGEPVLVAPEYGLSDLAEDMISKKGSTKQTADAVRYCVRRFKELHGDIPLRDIEIGHLAEYADRIIELPTSTSPQIRALKFNASAALAARDGLPTITGTTRKNHIAHLKSLTKFAVPAGRLIDDPFLAFGLAEKRVKYSVQAKSGPVSFTARQVREIFEEVRANKHCDTIDRWGPFVAAYQGARLEEICQILVVNVKTVDGVPCIELTDEDDIQKIKNKSSFRTIPIHPALLNEGFMDLVDRRGAINSKTLFAKQDRHGGAIHDLQPDERGRLAEAYGKRFARVCAKCTRGDERKLVFHSFRHRWQDAANNADGGSIPDRFRRYLAGRAQEDIVEAGYGKGPSMKNLLLHLAKIDPLDPSF